MNRMMMMQARGETHRCLKLTSDWTETGNLEHIQRWSFSWELIAHARTSSLSHRQIWGTPILLIVRPTYELPLLLLLLFINHGSVPWGKLDFRVWYHISSKFHSSKEELYFLGGFISSTAFYFEFVLNRLDLACSDLSKLVRACPNLSRLVQACSNLSRNIKY